MRRLIALAAAGVVAAAIVAGWFAVSEAERRSRLVLGESVYAEQCASCHGDNLEGQPDWQTPLPSGRMPAPPHDASGHTWHHSDEALFLITKDGMAALVPDYESDMPAFGEILSNAEIAAVLDFIKSTWPERERAYQEERNR
jgi:mono/diheme cytochrome c family protein